MPLIKKMKMQGKYVKQIVNIGGKISALGWVIRVL